MILAFPLLPTNDNEPELKVIACAECRSQTVNLFLEPLRIACSNCGLDMTTDCLEHMELMQCQP